jgi:hypothetical protein
VTDTTSSRDRGSAWRIAGWFAVAAVFALFAAASFLPEKRLWGLNHLAFYPGGLRLPVLVVTGLFLVPPVASLASRGALRIGRAWLRGLENGSNTLALSGVISFVVFAAFRSSTKLLGDGYFVFNNYRKAAENGLGPGQFFSQVTTAERIYPGTEFLGFLASWIAGRFGASPTGGVWILNCVIGALVVVLLLCVVRRLDWPDGVRLAALALALATGALQLFFGYIEHYTAPLALAVLYVVLAARTDGRWRGLAGPGLVLVAGVFFHVQMLLLAPSFLWLMLRAAAGRGDPARGLRLAVATGLLTIAAVVAGGFRAPLGNYLIPLSGDGYTVFSAAHLLDVLNVVLLLFPALLLLAVAALFGRGDGGREVLSYAVVLGVPAWLFVLLFRPELGAARDWDLYAFAAIGLAAPGLLWLSRSAAAGGRPASLAPVLAPAVVVSAALVISWIGVNASAERSVARYRAILVYDTTNPGYAYENLALHYQDNYQYTLQIDALEKAYEVSRNPRMLLKLGRVYSDSNKPAKAEQAMREYLALVPENNEARIWLLGQLARRAELDEMIELSLEGIRYWPRVPDYHFFLGNAYLASGQKEEGLQAFEACSRLNPPPAMVREMKRLAEEAGRGEGVNE